MVHSTINAHHDGFGNAVVPNVKKLDFSTLTMAYRGVCSSLKDRNRVIVIYIRVMSTYIVHVHVHVIHVL